MEELDKYLNDSKPTLVEFYADWCSHCQNMMPVMDELMAKTGDRAHIVQIEGDEHPDLMQKYNVRSYPTFILFKDGQQAWRDSGEKHLGELEDMLHRFE